MREIEGKIKKKDARSILNGIADNLNEQDRDDLKEILSGLIDRIVFDFSNLEYCINYKIPVKSRELVASPRAYSEIPTIITTSTCKILRKRLAICP